MESPRRDHQSVCFLRRGDQLWDVQEYRRGLRWGTINAGLNIPEDHSLTIDRRTPTTLYVGTDRTSVFKSTDTGGYWTLANAGLTNIAVMRITIDPTTSTTLYFGTEGAGVLKSMDGGRTWTHTMGDAVAHIIAIDPLTPTTLYALRSSAV